MGAGVQRSGTTIKSLELLDDPTHPIKLQELQKRALKEEVKTMPTDFIETIFVHA